MLVAVGMATAPLAFTMPLELATPFLPGASAAVPAFLTPASGGPGLFGLAAWARFLDWLGRTAGHGLGAHIDPRHVRRDVDPAP